MGDRATLAMARQELEGIYDGIPDDSVNLSFKDLASFQQNEVPVLRKSSMTLVREDLDESMKEKEELGESPSLDFSRGFQGTRESFQQIEDEMNHRVSVKNSMKKNKAKPLMVVVESSTGVFDDATSFNVLSPYAQQGGRRRPGIPHSNICSLCSTYVYLFRHRCLVCGRVYCRECVLRGMGDMAEGRKCIDCLGRRFSERYMHKAGQTGCCCWKYPGKVRMQEIKWAEKGPRRCSERQQGRTNTVWSTITPVTRGSPSMSYISRPTSPNNHNNNGSPYNIPTSPHVFPL